MAQSVRSHIGDGNNLYKDQKYPDAEAEYRKSLEKDNKIMQGYFDLGDALYKQQRYDEAAQNYENALTKTNGCESGRRAPSQHRQCPSGEERISGSHRRVQAVVETQSGR